MAPPVLPLLRLEMELHLPVEIFGRAQSRSVEPSRAQSSSVELSRAQSSSVELRGGGGLVGSPLCGRGLLLGLHLVLGLARF